VSHARFDSAYHAPVLVTEVLDVLGSAARVLDGTLGGGGHALALLERGADVTGIDRDPEAVAAARDRLAEFAAMGRFRSVRGEFGELDSIPELHAATFDGILLDLGVSSHQFDDAGRGFSFRQGAVLDMRMAGDARGSNRGTAADLLNSSDERELIRIFREYGDEPRAARLAHEIVRRRANRPFELSDDLVGAIRAVLGPRSGPGEFARLFQAVRIAVNDELEALARALPALRDRLVPGGVFAVIAYHSGEDRIVKNAFRDWSLSCVCPPRQPICTCRGHALGATIRKKAVIASGDEIARNSRARSARLRAWRSTDAGPPVARRATDSHRK
jgi:16S rRNA (cytosine1402-N4)-methyltransferase